MPNFTWDIDPIAIQFDKGTLMMVVGAIAALMLVVGLAKKQTDLAVFGLFLGAVLALLNNFVPDPVGIRYYSLLFVGVFLGGYALLNWQIQRGGGDEEAAGDFIVYGVAGVLIGSRLGHVIFYDLDHALQDPLWVLQIWTGGLASHGAVIGLIIAMWLFTRSRKVSFFEGADRFAFSAALGATLVRLGNFFNSEIVGRRVADQSWGVRFPRYDQHLVEAPLRYPTQVFEFLLGLSVLLSLYVVDRVAGREKRPRGLLISVFFLLYFAGRFCVEFFKEYQALESSSPLTMGQLLSIPGFFIGVFGVFASLRSKVPAGWNAPDSTAPDSAAAATSDEDEDDKIDPDVDDALSDEDEDDRKQDDDNEDEAPSKEDESSDSAKTKDPSDDDGDSDEKKIDDGHEPKDDGSDEQDDEKKKSD